MNEEPVPCRQFSLPYPSWMFASSSTCFLFLPAVPQAEASYLRARGLGITATVSSSPPSHLVVPPVCLGGTRKQISVSCFLSLSKGLTGNKGSSCQYQRMHEWKSIFLPRTYWYDALHTRYCMTVMSVCGSGCWRTRYTRKLLSISQDLPDRVKRPYRYDSIRTEPRSNFTTSTRTAPVGVTFLAGIFQTFRSSSTSTNNTSRCQW